MSIVIREDMKRRHHSGIPSFPQIFSSVASVFQVLFLVFDRCKASAAVNRGRSPEGIKVETIPVRDG